MGLTIQGSNPAALDSGQAGQLCFDQFLGLATRTAAANVAYFKKFTCHRNHAITVMAFNCTTAAGADDAVDLGIYDTSGNRLGSAGATTGKLTSQGIKTVTLTGTVNLVAGTTYYAAMSFGTLGGTAGVVEGHAAGNGTGTDNQIFGTAVGKMESGAVATSHPLPSSVTISTTTGAVPYLAVRES